VIGGRPGSAAAGSSASPRQSGAQRFLDGLAGLFAGGVLVVGVLLLLAAIIAPALLETAGLGPAQGPGALAVIMHLTVGVGGEIIIRLREPWPALVRVIADIVIIAAVAAVLALTWWW
jgi:hypothetical protein